MEYFINKHGYPQADFGGRFMCFEDDDFKTLRVKLFLKKGFLKDMGTYTTEKAKELWGDKYPNLIFIREGELVAILDD